MRDVFQRDRVNIVVAMSVALFLIITRGSSNNGQQGILSSVLNGYIQEQAVAMVPLSSYDMVKMNSVDAPSFFDRDRHPFELNTLQGNSLVPNAGRYADIVDDNDHIVDKDEIIKYEIQEGESLSLIAKDFGVSLNTIIWANNIKNVDAIKPGTVLKIPPVSGVIHKVKSGDTVSVIAKKYQAEIDDIISFNHLESDGTDLQIGDEIIVPHGKISATVTTSKSVTLTRFSNLPKLNGYFSAPTSGYNWGHIHGRNGVDIANKCGTPIYAAADGVVARIRNSGYNGGFGIYLMLTHANGTETLYAHHQKNLVSLGDKVKQGQQISLMGTTGRSTGCHLHFEVHGATNPMAK